MNIFEIDFRQYPADVRHVGDGFFAPIIRLQEFVIGPPDLVREFIHSRNILYAVLKRDQKRFDNAVSPMLEPHLLDQSEKLLGMIPDVSFGREIEWERGQIDLIVFDSINNNLIHFQANAAITPHGSRMVTRVEDQVRIAMISWIECIAPPANSLIIKLSKG